MLLASERHTAEDLRVWTARSRCDAMLGRRLDRKIERAAATLRAFAAVGAYCGVSWGKDSVVVAHMVVQLAPEVPIVWLRWEPMANPDCALVRDAFLSRFPATRYDEIESRWVRGESPSGWVSASDPRDRDGFKGARDRYGDRHVSGVRADESRTRKIRCAVWGETSPRTCAPLARWSASDAFAYLARFDLPVHPVYAMSYGGAIEREHLRVDCLGGLTGGGHGRREWEWTYYRDELIALGEDLRVRL